MNDSLRRGVARLRYHRQLGFGGLSLLLAHDLLAKLGLVVQPYYLVREHHRTEGVRPTVAPIEENAETDGEEVRETQGMRFVTLDLGLVHKLKEPFANWRRNSLASLAAGNRGICALQGDTPIATSWVGFDACAVGRLTLFPLASGEAYLLDAFTHPSYRGLGLAPVLRRHLYAMLHAEGYHTFWSVSHAFNRPAIRFKQKLGAQIDSLWIWLEIGSRSWRLRGVPPGGDRRRAFNLDNKVEGQSR